MPAEPIAPATGGMAGACDLHRHGGCNRGL